MWAVGFLLLLGADQLALAVDSSRDAFRQRVCMVSEVASGPDSGAARVWWWVRFLLQELLDWATSLTASAAAIAACAVLLRRSDPEPAQRPRVVGCLAEALQGGKPWAIIPWRFQFGFVPTVPEQRPSRSVQTPSRSSLYESGPSCSVQSPSRLYLNERAPSRGIQTPSRPSLNERAPSRGVQTPSRPSLNENAPSRGVQTPSQPSLNENAPVDETASLGADVSSERSVENRQLLEDTSNLQKKSSLEELQEKASLRELHVKRSVVDLHEKVSLEELLEKVSLEELHEKASLEKLQEKASLEALQERASLEDLQERSTLEESQEKATLDELHRKASLETIQEKQSLEEKASFKDKSSLKEKSSLESKASLEEKVPEVILLKKATAQSSRISSDSEVQETCENLVRTSEAWLTLYRSKPEVQEHHKEPSSQVIGPSEQLVATLTKYLDAVVTELRVTNSRLACVLPNLQDAVQQPKKGREQPEAISRLSLPMSPRTKSGIQSPREMLDEAATKEVTPTPSAPGDRVSATPIAPGDRGDSDPGIAAGAAEAQTSASWLQAQAQEQLAVERRLYERRVIALERRLREVLSELQVTRCQLAEALTEQDFRGRKVPRIDVGSSSNVSLVSSTMDAMLSTASVGSDSASEARSSASVTPTSTCTVVYCSEHRAGARSSATSMSVAATDTFTSACAMVDDVVQILSEDEKLSFAHPSRSSPALLTPSTSVRDITDAETGPEDMQAQVWPKDSRHQKTRPPSETASESSFVSSVSESEWNTSDRERAPAPASRSWSEMSVNWFRAMQQLVQQLRNADRQPQSSDETTPPPESVRHSSEEPSDSDRHSDAVDKRPKQQPGPSSSSERPSIEVPGSGKSLVSRMLGALIPSTTSAGPSASQARSSGEESQTVSEVTIPSPARVESSCSRRSTNVVASTVSFKVPATEVNASGKSLLSRMIGVLLPSSSAAPSASLARSSGEDSKTVSDVSISSPAGVASSGSTNVVASTVSCLGHQLSSVIILTPSPVAMESSTGQTRHVGAEGRSRGSLNHSWAKATVEKPLKEQVLLQESHDQIQTKSMSAQIAVRGSEQMLKEQMSLEGSHDQVQTKSISAQIPIWGSEQTLKEQMSPERSHDQVQTRTIPVHMPVWGSEKTLKEQMSLEGSHDQVQTKSISAEVPVWGSEQPLKEQTSLEGSYDQLRIKSVSAQRPEWVSEQAPKEQMPLEESKGQVQKKDMSVQMGSDQVILQKKSVASGPDERGDIAAPVAKPGHQTSAENIDVKQLFKKDEDHTLITERIQQIILKEGGVQTALSNESVQSLPQEKKTKALQKDGGMHKQGKKIPVKPLLKETCVQTMQLQESGGKGLLQERGSPRSPPRKQPQKARSPIKKREEQETLKDRKCKLQPKKDSVQVVSKKGADSSVPLKQSKDRPLPKTRQTQSPTKQVENRQLNKSGAQGPLEHTGMPKPTLSEKTTMTSTSIITLLPLQNTEMPTSPEGEEVEMSVDNYDVQSILDAIEPRSSPEDKSIQTSQQILESASPVSDVESVRTESASILATSKSSCTQASTLWLQGLQRLTQQLREAPKTSSAYIEHLKKKVPSVAEDSVGSGSLLSCAVNTMLTASSSSTVSDLRKMQHADICSAVKDSETFVSTAKEAVDDARPVIGGASGDSQQIDQEKESGESSSRSSQFRYEEGIEQLLETINIMDVTQVPSKEGVDETSGPEQLPQDEKTRALVKKSRPPKRRRPGSPLKRSEVETFPTDAISRPLLAQEPIPEQRKDIGTQTIKRKHVSRVMTKKRAVPKTITERVDEESEEQSEAEVREEKKVKLDAQPSVEAERDLALSSGSNVVETKSTSSFASWTKSLRWLSQPLKAASLRAKQRASSSLSPSTTADEKDKMRPLGGDSICQDSSEQEIPPTRDSGARGKSFISCFVNAMVSDSSAPTVTLPPARAPSECHSDISGKSESTVCICAMVTDFDSGSVTAESFSEDSNTSLQKKTLGSPTNIAARSRLQPLPEGSGDQLVQGEKTPSSHRLPTPAKSVASAHSVKSSSGVAAPARRSSWTHTYASWLQNQQVPITGLEAKSPDVSEQQSPTYQEIYLRSVRLRSPSQHSAMTVPSAAGDQIDQMEASSSPSRTSTLNDWQPTLEDMDDQLPTDGGARVVHRLPTDIPSYTNVQDASYGGVKLETKRSSWTDTYMSWLENQELLAQQLQQIRLRSESRGEPCLVSHGESHFASRAESRGEPCGGSPGELRGESRGESRDEAREELRGESHEELRDESADELRDESRDQLPECHRHMVHKLQVLKTTPLSASKASLLSGVVSAMMAAAGSASASGSVSGCSSISASAVSVAAGDAPTATAAPPSMDTFPSPILTVASSTSSVATVRTPSSAASADITFASSISSATAATTSSRNDSCSTSIYAISPNIASTCTKHSTISRANSTKGAHTPSSRAASNATTTSASIAKGSYVPRSRAASPTIKSGRSASKSTTTSASSGKGSYAPSRRAASPVSKFDSSSAKHPNTPRSRAASPTIISGRSASKATTTSATSGKGSYAPSSRAASIVNELDLSASNAKQPYAPSSGATSPTIILGRSVSKATTTSASSAKGSYAPSSRTASPISEFDESASNIATNIDKRTYAPSSGATSPNITVGRSASKATTTSASSGKGSYAPSSRAASPISEFDESAISSSSAKHSYAPTSGATSPNITVGRSASKATTTSASSGKGSYAPSSRAASPISECSRAASPISEYDESAISSSSAKHSYAPSSGANSPLIILGQSASNATSTSASSEKGFYATSSMTASPISKFDPSASNVTPICASSAKQYYAPSSRTDSPSITFRRSSSQTTETSEVPKTTSTSVSKASFVSGVVSDMMAAASSSGGSASACSSINAPVAITAANYAPSAKATSIPSTVNAPTSMATSPSNVNAVSDINKTGTYAASSNAASPIISYVSSIPRAASPSIKFGRSAPNATTTSAFIAKGSYGSNSRAASPTSKLGPSTTNGIAISASSAKPPYTHSTRAPSPSITFGRSASQSPETSEVPKKAGVSNSKASFLSGVVSDMMAAGSNSPSACSSISAPAASVPTNYAPSATAPSIPSTFTAPTSMSTSPSAPLVPSASNIITIPDSNKAVTYATSYNSASSTMRSPSPTIRFGQSTFDVTTSSSSGVKSFYDPNSRAAPKPSKFDSCASNVITITTSSAKPSYAPSSRTASPYISSGRSTSQSPEAQEVPKKMAPIVSKASLLSGVVNDMMAAASSPGGSASACSSISASAASAAADYIPDTMTTYITSTITAPTRMGTSPSSTLASSASNITAVSDINETGTYATSSNTASPIMTCASSVTSDNSRTIKFGGSASNATSTSSSSAKGCYGRNSRIPSPTSKCERSASSVSSGTPVCGATQTCKTIARVTSSSTAIQPFVSIVANRYSPIISAASPASPIITSPSSASNSSSSSPFNKATASPTITITNSTSSMDNASISYVASPIVSLPSSSSSASSAPPSGASKFPDATTAIKSVAVYHPEGVNKTAGPFASICKTEQTTSHIESGDTRSSAANSEDNKQETDTRLVLYTAPTAAEATRATEGQATDGNWLAQAGRMLSALPLPKGPGP